jgi:nucleoid-associated protein YgaU
MQAYNKILFPFLGIVFAAGCASTEPAKEAPKEEAPAVAEVKPAPAPEPVAPKEVRKPDDTYNVVRGDHLWGISSKPAIYGNPYQWPLIYKANRDRIKDADLIEPGQVFTINRNASGAEVDAAVQHAKTRGAWKLGVVEESDQRYLAR